MNVREFVIKWNNSFRYDYWWRQKHNIAFGSDAHRAMNPSDIAFEYFEYHLAEKAVEQFKEEERKAKDLKDGVIVKKNKTLEDQLWDKIDLSQF